MDGEDRGNSIAVSGGDFVGIAYANTSGGVDDVTIIGIRDALVGGEVSGNQRGNALVVSNTGPAKTFSLTDSTITEFQKTGAIFRDMDVTVDHNEIDGNGPHAIIGQNAMQLSSGSFGDVTNNTISGIGYTGPADIVVGGVLVFDSIGRIAHRQQHVQRHRRGRRRHLSQSTPRTSKRAATPSTMPTTASSTSVYARVNDVTRQ